MNWREYYSESLCMRAHALITNNTSIGAVAKRLNERWWHAKFRGHTVLEDDWEPLPEDIQDLEEAKAVAYAMWRMG